MKILLDECIDWRLAKELPGHDVSNVARMGWQGSRNGELLNHAREAGFDVLVTVDRNLAFQRNLASGDLAVFVLRAPSNRLGDLIPLAPKLLAALPEVERGVVRIIT